MFIKTPALQSLVDDFVARFVVTIETHISQRIRGIVSSALSGSGAPEKPVVRLTKASAKAEPRPIARRHKLSAKGLAVRKLQGKYMGTLRGLSLAKRLQVKKVAHEKGLAAAITFGASLR